MNDQFLTKSHGSALEKLIMAILKILTDWLPFAGVIGAIIAFGQGSFICAGVLIAATSLIAYWLNKLGLYFARNAGIPPKRVRHEVDNYKTGRRSSYTTYEQGGFETTEAEHQTFWAPIQREERRKRIGLFIAKLEVEDSNLRSIIARVLREETGQDFGEDKDKWQEWWNTNLFF